MYEVCYVVFYNLINFEFNILNVFMEFFVSLRVFCIVGKCVLVNFLIII